MDLSKIGYFLTAAETLNFTQAAERCHISQTTMSKYISGLERELNCILFTRTHRTVRLTPAGERFYIGIRGILLSYRALCEELVRDVGKELRIGIVATDYIDSAVLRSFEEETPDIRLFFRYDEKARMLQELQDRRVDALIAPDVLEIGGRDLCRLPILRIDEDLVCSRQLLETCGSLVRVIESTSFITKTDSTAYHSACRRMLRRHLGADFSDVLQVQSFAEQLMNLGMSRGFALIPSGTAANTETLAAFPMREIYSETAELIYRESHVPDALRRLIRFVSVRTDEKIDEKKE